MPEQTTVSPVNPMVEYLNSLRTQEQGANASYIHEQRAAFLEGLRAENPWFPPDSDLHVATKLDALGTAMRDRQALGAELVFLTGDAGDGKTALCDVLAPVLAGGPVGLDAETVAGEWLIVKDASELPEARLRQVIFDRLDGGSKQAVLVAINEGRLRRVMRERADVWREVVEPSLRTLRSSEEASALDEAMRRHRILVLNFRQRFHVRSVLPSLLEKWTREPLWEGSPACGSCEHRQLCPILANVKELRTPGPQGWLADLLVNAHFAGQRLPFRRLQALLALSCTGGLHCDRVRDGSFAGPGALRALRHRYYEVLFPPDPAEPVDVRREMLCAALAPVDPGRRVSRELDSAVLELVTPAQPSASAPSLANRELPDVERRAVEAARSRYAANAAPDEFARSLAALTRSLRRWHEVARLDRSTTPPRWLEAQRSLERCARGDCTLLLPTVMTALNALHGPGHKPNRLLRNQADPAGFRDPERLALELNLQTEFDAEIVRGPILPSCVTAWIETEPSELELQVWPTGHPGERATLQLDARLVDALVAVCRGYTALGGLGPFRRDLSRFFGKLGQLAQSAVGPPLVSLQVEGRRTKVTTVGSAGAARLSFEVDA
ncbi:hypothetical protein ACOQFB_05265 [Anaeromyxobacter sp. Red801]|uniref:hypothetical protein n=1 Tax=Anaeromyxobacter sp. Red801 TaxID=3411632 RepID=UPI003B9ECE8A